MYVSTKVGERIFIRSKVMEGVPNFKFRSRDPDHAHFRDQFVLYWLVHVSVFAPSMKFLSLVIPKT